MKKSLVLAMAMALGVTASAYAANPFSDVPAGHWAYDSVAKLAAAGVVDGYADGAFAGDKLITRYEMAQIVAKAMAKGADCDKLAAEFADELDTLGVRVAKLEKAADAVKITGNIRASYRDGDAAEYMKLRTRLFVKGQINDDWSYTGRLQQDEDLRDNAGSDSISLNWAYVEGKIGGLKATLGRQNFAINSKQIIDCEFDGAKFAYGKDVKVTAFAGKASNAAELAWVADADDKTVDNGYSDAKSDDRFYAVDVNTKVAGIPVYATYYKADQYDQEIWNVGATLKVAPKTALKLDWARGESDRKVANDDKNGYIATVAYAGAKASAPGSFGVWATYYDMPANTYFKNTANTQSAVMESYKLAGYGYEGFEVGANYALAKNIVAAVRYFDLEQNDGTKESQNLWTEVVFTF